MLHIAFNYHDSNIQLRLEAILAVVAIIACLAVIEFKRRLTWWETLLISLVIGIGCTAAGYVFIKLKGA